MEKTFTLTHRILMPEVDISYHCRPDILLALMQEAVGKHNKILGIGRLQMRPYNIIWMIAATQFHLTSYPLMGETIRIETWCGPIEKATQPRNFRFYRECGECFGYASSAWMMVDKTRKKILLQNKLPFSMADFSGEALPLPEPVYCRVHRTFNTPICATRTPQYSDIDLNGHLNNTGYMRWIEDLFDLDRHRNCFLSDFNIHYSSEAKPASPVSLYLMEDGLSFSIVGEHPDSARVFEARGTFAPRSIKEN